MRVGGPARQVLTPTSTEELVEVIGSLDAAGEPLLVVGGGSNVLVADSGFAGTVVRLGTRGWSVVERDDESVTVQVSAGEPWDALVAAAVESGWAGPAALSGIPGSAGATPVQNVGAYGSEVGHWIDRVEVLDRRTGSVRMLERGDLGLGYRTSLLKAQPHTWVVLSVFLRLPVDRLSAPVAYSELAAVLDLAVGERAPGTRVREAVLELRRAKGMVLDPADHDTWSAGSFFTNPVLDQREADRLPEDAPRYPGEGGRVKTSAAWLITHAGFARGFSVRPDARAALSGKHSLALTNRGGATAADLLELARVVRAGVAEKFGVVLDNEPVLVGCRL